MERLDASVLVSPSAYERLRPEYGRWVSEQRQARRVRLGTEGVLQFEIPEFAVWHVHELLRVEGWSERRVRRTLEDVAPWCAGVDEISATVMLDGVAPERGARIAEALSRPGGLRLWAGDHVLGSELAEPGTSSDPVWYLRWRVPRWWPSVLQSARRCVAEPTWDAGAVTLPQTTIIALRADLLEARGRRKPILQRLALRTQRHVQSQRTRHSARP